MATEQFANAGRNDGRLYYAVVRGDLKTVNEELQSGDVDLSPIIGGKSFLRHAGERGFKQIAELLVRHGLDPNETYGQQQGSLLHIAATTFNFGFASVLLEHGANPSARTTSGATALHIAARSGQSYLTIKLIEAGADLNAKDSQGRTALTLAIDNGMVATAEILAHQGEQKTSQPLNQQCYSIADAMGPT